MHMNSSDLDENPFASSVPTYFVTGKLELSYKFR